MFGKFACIELRSLEERESKLGDKDRCMCTRWCVFDIIVIVGWEYGRVTTNLVIS